MAPCLKHITQRRRSEEQHTDSSFVWRQREDERCLHAVARPDERSFPYKPFLMLTKASRLKAYEFKGVKTRLVYRGAFFDLAAAQAPSLKFACVISRKRIKRAVDRNKAKRRIYACLEGVQTKSPFFVFIYPTKQILQASHKALQEEITKAFATL